MGACLCTDVSNSTMPVDCRVSFTTEKFDDVFDDRYVQCVQLDIPPETLKKQEQDEVDEKPRQENKDLVPKLDLQEDEQKLVRFQFERDSERKPSFDSGDEKHITKISPVFSKSGPVCCKHDLVKKKDSICSDWMLEASEGIDLVALRKSQIKPLPDLANVGLRERFSDATLEKGGLRPKSQMEEILARVLRKENLKLSASSSDEDSSFQESSSYTSSHT